MVTNYLARLFLVLASLCCSHLFSVADCTEDITKSEKYIIKDCNSIQYRLMVDFGEPPFPETACEIKQKTITCFEKSEGSGERLDKDRFLLLQSAVVDKVLMCPNLKYQELQQSIQNSVKGNSGLGHGAPGVVVWSLSVVLSWLGWEMLGDISYDKATLQCEAAVQELLKEYPTASQQVPEQCAFDIHKSCEKKIFDQVVVNHLSWPKTTKWRQCYDKALQKTPCSASILQNYATLQEKFGESFRQEEYDLGLFGIFMNDHQNQQSIEIL